MNAKAPEWIAVLWGFITDVKKLSILLAGLCGGGITATALGDVGVTPAEADSISRANDAPILERLASQDTAIMLILWRQDVQMSDDEKARADSLMRAAFKNINYGGLRK